MTIGFEILKKIGPYVLGFVLLLGAGKYGYDWIYDRGHADGSAEMLGSWNAQKALDATAAAKAESETTATGAENIQADAVVVANAQDHQAAVKSNFEAINKDVNNYVETHNNIATCSIDADGLRLWNAANTAAGRSAISTSDNGVTSAVDSVSAAAAAE